MNSASWPLDGHYGTPTFALQGSTTHAPVGAAGSDNRTARLAERFQLVQWLMQPWGHALRHSAIESAAKNGLIDAVEAYALRYGLVKGIVEDMEYLSPEYRALSDAALARFREAGLTEESAEEDAEMRRLSAAMDAWTAEKTAEVSSMIGLGPLPTGWDPGDIEIVGLRSLVARAEVVE